MKKWCPETNSYCFMKDCARWIVTSEEHGEGCCATVVLALGGFEQARDTLSRERHAAYDGYQVAWQ